MALAQSEGLNIRFIEKTHIGRRKKEQQDYQGHLLLPADKENNRPAVHLFVVADGVSMGAAGALASRTAVEFVLNCFKQLVQDEGKTDLADALEQAFQAGADEILRLSEEHHGMATTFVAALTVGDRLITAHIGDSRVYLAFSTPQGFQLKPMGVDHSWVEEAGRAMVLAGELKEGELLTDNRRHSITRAFGMEGEVLVDFNSSQLQNNDLVLVCSDGLWDLIEPLLLKDMLVDAATDLKALQGEAAEIRLQTLADRLEETAMVAGGRDNITLTLLWVEKIGRPYSFPSLPRLLARTTQDIEERTGLTEETAPIEVLSTPVSFRPYQPTPPARLPNSNNDEATVPINLDAIFSKAQKLFALGHWDEAFDEFLQVERHEPSYHNLFEIVSNALTRYVEGAISQNHPERVSYLFKRLNEAGVTRYNDLLFEFCLEESRQASRNKEYAQAKTMIDFAMQLRSNDTRARNQQELNELYLQLNQSNQLALADKLAIAQRIYARDADFGGIQDDLATIYMELGDEAVRNKADNEALGWYQIIRSLKPEDARLISLAASKQRSLEDTISRQRETETSRARAVTQPLANRSSLNQRNRQKEIVDKPENEAINRLRDRVSRAQKAWDAGRKEVGAEYIYLVEQLNSLISPNPWQPTFPRVCYDYGKWLLDQKQYGEARPYFIKAQTLGMAAAQQRINEIDRILRENGTGSKIATAPNLASNEEIITDDSNLNPSPTAALLSELRLGVANLTSRQPLIQRKIEIPPDTIFVGANNTSEDTPKTGGNGNFVENERPPSPLSAAAMAAGNSLPPPSNFENNGNNFEKPERLVGASGTLRRRDNSNGGDPLQDAAQREISRLQNQGLPLSNAQPEVMRRRQREGFVSFISGLTPAFTIAIVVVVVLVAILIGVGLYTNANQKTEQNRASSATATTSVGTTTLTTNPTNQVTTPAAASRPAISTKLDGVAPADVRVFLAAPGETSANYRDRELNFDSSANLFRLPPAALNTLDAKTRYMLIVRPKDTATRKFAADLPADSPLLTLWTKPDLSVSGGNLDVSLKIAPEALSFYPVDNGDQDLDLPDGGRYFKATRHNVLSEFYRYYNANGGLGRFGFPVSEEFDWKEVGGTVQFFERGWLVKSGNPSSVRIGKLGQTVLDEASYDSNLKPPASVGTATYKVDAAFADSNINNRYGKPLSAAFEISLGNSKKRVQYFEFARLEVDPANKNAPTTLGLLGTEYARARDWLR